MARHTVRDSDLDGLLRVANRDYTQAFSKDLDSLLTTPRKVLDAMLRHGLKQKPNKRRIPPPPLDT